MVALAPEAERQLADIADAELARRRLRDYCMRADPDYLPAAHADLIIGHLEALELREIRRLMVLLPPRHSKTYHVSERYPAWWLGRRPSDAVIMASYAAELAQANSRRVRNLLQDVRYPFETRLAADSKAVGLWGTAQGGRLLAAGVGSGITGFGADLLNIDDPFKDRQEAESETIREHVWLWYQDVARTRLQSGGVVLLTQTRWHEDDLAGHLLNSAGSSDWTLLRLPALAEDEDVLGRQPGEALWPELFPLAELPSVERGEISARAFASLYQQRPVPAEGGAFKRSWMERRWHELPTQRPAEPDPEWKPPSRWAVIQTTDTAWDKGVGHDFSAIATWGTDGHSYYLIDVWHERVEYPDLRLAARVQYETHRPAAIFVEDKANGRVLVQDLRRSGLPVMPTRPEGSKEARADAATPAFASGKVVLPANAPWLQGWIDEHLAFPNGQHDDQVDTTSEAIKQLDGMTAQPRGAIPIEVRKGGDALGDRPELSDRRRKALQERLTKRHFPRVRI